MHPETRNPAALETPTGSGMLSWAANGSDHTISRITINRLSQRFGYSLSVAARIAELAGLGPREARS